MAITLMATSVRTIGYHRLQQTGAQLLALFGIVRQSVQDAVKMTGSFPAATMAQYS